MQIYDKYYYWLLDQVMYDSMKKYGRNYSKLLKAMRRKAFTWTIPNDENRANDGKNLRTKFYMECGYTEEIKGACSFLEMSIALAMRIHNDIFEHDPGSRPSRWFWLMMENCGLDAYTDECFDELMVNKLMDRVIRRRYSKTGKGGFFPLKRPQADQKEVEIWYQMQQFLIENYD